MSCKNPGKSGKTRPLGLFSDSQPDFRKLELYTDFEDFTPPCVLVASLHRAITIAARKYGFEAFSFGSRFTPCEGQP
jgi:hypothetical protein